MASSTGAKEGGSGRIQTASGLVLSMRGGGKGMGRGMSQAGFKLPAVCCRLQCDSETQGDTRNFFEASRPDYRSAATETRGSKEMPLIGATASPCPTLLARQHRAVP